MARPGLGFLARKSHRGLHSSQECSLAQELFPRYVLASGERSGHYVRAGMRALMGKGQAGARLAQSVLKRPLIGTNQHAEDKTLFIMVPATR